MKRPHTLRLLLCITVCAFGARLAVAQLNLSFSPGETAVITMKSGEKFEGKVLNDAPDSVEIEYRLTPKIKDKKILQKSDIAGVKKQRPSETEFAERGLGKLLPTPDLKEAPYYESTIQDKLRTFVAKYPGTPEAVEVEKIIAIFGEEKSKVVSGQLKVEGRWLDAATVKRDSYNIDAYRELIEMEEKAAESKDTRYLDALRAFDKLSSDYSASPHFLKAVPEAQEILKKFEIQLSDMIKEAPILQKRRDDGLKQLPANEAPAAKKAIDEEKRAYEETAKRQKADKVKWIDIYKYDVKGLQETLVTIATERRELAALDLNALQTESETLMTAIRYIADKNLVEAAAALDKASKMAANTSSTASSTVRKAALIKKLTDDLDNAKKNELKEQKATANAPKAAPPAPVEGAPPAANPMAEVLKKVLEEKQKKTPEPAKGPDGKPLPPGAAPAPKAAPAAAPTPAAPPAPEPEPSFMDKLNDYLPIVGGGLLLAIGVAWFLKKRKKEQA